MAIDRSFTATCARDGSFLLAFSGKRKSSGGLGKETASLIRYELG